MPSHPSLESTQVLLERARHGDDAAREVLAARYLQALRRFAHGRLPAASRGLLDTEDLVQMAVVRTLHNLGSFDPAGDGSLLAYLRTAVLNHIRDEIRRTRRRPLHEGLDPGIRAPDPDPLEAVISGEAAARYEAALARLPAEQQEAFLLRIEMGCGYQEIAESLGRPSANAARMLVRRAVGRLAEELRPPAAP